MKIKIIIAVCASVITLLLSAAIGSVYIPPQDILRVIAHNVFGLDMGGHINPAHAAIVWNLRLPRALLAFCAGAALSVSGAVMQSVLRNPLASSYTLGVSSGASLGASLVIFAGVNIPFISMFTMPLLGFVFGLGAILIVMGISRQLDARMENHTVILTGMVFALFLNAVTTLMFAFFREGAQRMVFWQMGSFAMKDWYTVYILAPAALAGVLFTSRFNKELDIMTFGEDNAQTVGVNIRGVKLILLITAAALTGSAIAFVGIIGFVDLAAPHIVRRIFGSSHKHVIPMSALFGGAFMALADLAARTVTPPAELPVGAVTALIGAPFFAWVYFKRRKK
ncbi:MAG: iron ABC transporter permease [Treponema sp.]|nr:iron ABC transporter permease [Treponema sp.]